MNIKKLLETEGVGETLKFIDKTITDKRKIQLMCVDFAESAAHIWEEWAVKYDRDNVYLPRSFIGLMRGGGAEGKMRKMLFELASSDVEYYCPITEAASELACEAVCLIASVSEVAKAKEISDFACEVAYTRHIQNIHRTLSKSESAGIDIEVKKSELIKQKAIILKHFGETYDKPKQTKPRSLHRVLSDIDHNIQNGYDKKEILEDIEQIQSQLESIKSALAAKDDYNLATRIINPAFNERYQDNV